MLPIKRSRIEKAVLDSTDSSEEECSSNSATKCYDSLNELSTSSNLSDDSYEQGINGIWSSTDFSDSDDSNLAEKCYVCSNEHSTDFGEIIKCGICGISVHEKCYEAAKLRYLKKFASKPNKKLPKSKTFGAAQQLDNPLPVTSISNPLRGTRKIELEAPLARNGVPHDRACTPVLKICETCKMCNDQHLFEKCDSCKFDVHLACLESDIDEASESD